MKTLVLAWLVVLGGLSSSWGTLGDDEAAATLHYGKPVSHSANVEQDKQTRIYEFNGFRVVVTFDHGRSVSEGFFQLGGAHSFAEVNIQKILQAQAGGQAWRELPTPNGIRLWIRPGAIATYGEERGKAQLAVMTYSGSPDDVIKSAVAHALATPAG